MKKWSTCIMKLRRSSVVWVALLLFAALSDSPVLAAEVNPDSSPAHVALRRFQRGANLGNYLEAPPDQNWGVTISASDFKQIRLEGFDHVRIPVAWHHHTVSKLDLTLKPEIFKRVDRLIEQAEGQGLSVLVNLHHFDAFTSDPAGQTEALVTLWRQIVAHYVGHSDGLAFEILNEPRDAATTQVMAPIYERVIAEIRKTHPNRTLFVGPGKYNSIHELKHLKLPELDRNLVVTVHCYEPFYFTHQGATWSGPDVLVKGYQFPGPPASPLVPDPTLKLNPWVIRWIERYNTLPAHENPSSPAAFEALLKMARAWGEMNRRPVHVGEFGCYTTADPESRARYYTAFRQALGREKLAWAIWDWNAGFRYWNPTSQAPEPGLREALFGK